MQNSQHYSRPDAVAKSASDLATACVLCSHNCGIRVDVEDNHITAVRPDANNPVSHGYSCNKVQAINHYVHHAQRVTQPLKRREDGGFDEISWEQAFTEIAAKLNHIRDNHAARAIGIAGVGGQGNHGNGLGAVPFLTAIGSPMLFTALGQEKTQHALVDRRLFKASHDTYLPGDEHHSHYVVVIGSNPLISNRNSNASESFKALAKDASRELVVIDPRVTETSRKANRHLQLAPATDLYMLLGLAATLVQENLVDRDFIQQKVEGYSQVAKVLAGIDIDDMASRCDVDAEAIKATAREFAAAPSACISWDLGIEQTPSSTVISYLIRVISLITGNLGRRGGNTFIRQFGPTLPYIKTMPKLLESGIEAIPMFVPIPQFPPAAIPEEILSSHPERLRALIVDGANPLTSYPDSAAFREAFAALDLLVVIEPAMSETALAADYVLPTPTGYEKWEFSSFPRINIAAQWRPPVVNGPENALPEPEIYYRLARSMGLVSDAPSSLHKLAKHARSAFGTPAYLSALTAQSALRGGGAEAIAGRAAFWLYETLGARLPNPTLAGLWILMVGYASTRRSEILRANPELKKIRNPFALAETLFQKMLDSPGGVLLGELDPDRNFEDFCNYRGGKAKIAQRDFLADITQAAATPAEASDSDYPFTLNGGMRTGWSTNTIVRDPSWRKGKGPHYALRISTDDAASMNLANNDLVLLESKRGSFEVPIKIDKGCRPGSLHIPNIFNLEYPDPETGELKATGVSINELSDASDRDPYTGCPNHKRIRVRLTALASEFKKAS